MTFLWYITIVLSAITLIVAAVVFTAAKIAKFLLVEKQKRELRRIKRNGEFKSSVLGPEEYDVIIVGAGPAGSTTAYHCAQSRLKVLLLDRASFPRGKCCGGVIAEPAVKLLTQMGIYEELENQNHLSYSDTATVISPSGISYTGSLGNKNARIITINRNVLDERILQKAIQLGATFKGTWEVVNAALDAGKGMWSVKSSTGDEHKGRMLVCADGAQSRLAQKLGLCSEPPLAACSYTAITTSKADECRFAYRAETLPGFCSVIQQSKKEAALICCLNRGPQKGLLGNVKAEDLPRITDHVLKENDMQSEAISEGKHHAMTSDAIRSACQGVDCTFGEHVVVIGDAAGFADPLTGMGIHTAMLSAKCAAETIIDMRREGNFIKRSCAVYEDRWINAFGYDFAMGRAIANVVYKYPLTLDAWVSLIRLVGDRMLRTWSRLATCSQNKETLLEPRRAIPLACVSGYYLIKERLVKKGQ